MLLQCVKMKIPEQYSLQDENNLEEVNAGSRIQLLLYYSLSKHMRYGNIICISYINEMIGKTSNSVRTLFPNLCEFLRGSLWTRNIFVMIQCCVVLPSNIHVYLCYNPLVCQTLFYSTIVIIMYRQRSASEPSVQCDIIFYEFHARNVLASTFL